MEIMILSVVAVGYIFGTWTTKVQVKARESKGITGDKRFTWFKRY